MARAGDVRSRFDDLRGGPSLGMGGRRGDESSSSDEVESLFHSLRSEATVVDEASLRFRECALEVTLGRLDCVEADRLWARIPGVAGVGGDVGRVFE
jgi:hypothetical protein